MSLDVFLYLSNGIKGESQDDQHPDLVDVIAWSWGLSQSGTTHMGGGGGGGKVAVQDITLTKYVDLATGDLIQRCANGEHIDSGYLIVRKAGGGQPVEYMRIDLREIMISSYATGGSSDGLDRVQETLTLNFRYFQVTYKTQDETGAEGTEKKAGWDIGGNVKWQA